MRATSTRNSTTIPAPFFLNRGQELRCPFVYPLAPFSLSIKGNLHTVPRAYNWGTLSHFLAIFPLAPKREKSDTPAPALVALI